MSAHLGMQLPSTDPAANLAASQHLAAVQSWMQELAPYGLLTTDKELKIHSWNEWMEAHSGLAAPLVIGHPVVEIFPDLVTRKMDEHFRRALAGEVIVLSSAFHDYLLPMQSTVREAGYASMQQTARIAPLTLAGEICGTIVIIEDVTQREAQAADLARRHTRDQLLAGCLAHLLRAREPRTMLRDFFPKMAEFLGLQAFFIHLVTTDNQGMRLHDFAGLTEEQAARIETLPPINLAGSPDERRPNLLDSDSASAGPLPVPINALGLRTGICHPLMVGERSIGMLSFGRKDRRMFSSDELEFIVTISQYVAVALDRVINEAALQQAQEKLREHAHDLETKVQERTAKLQDTIAQLETFSYTVAHDLRAPIRALKGYVHVLLEDHAPDGKTPAHTYLLKLDRAANRLEALTRDLLQFSTVSRQDVRLEPIEIGEVLQDIRLLRPSLHEEVLEIKHPLVPVLAQRTLLQQCLSNLLDNALKFNSPGNLPHITVWTERTMSQNIGAEPASFSTGLHAAKPEPGSSGHAQVEKSPRVRIYVEDNGIGIAEESRKKIFGLFERLNPSDKYEGTGIGLAIVARAAQRMGGSCGVEPGRQSGSRFWLELKPAPDFGA